MLIILREIITLTMLKKENNDIINLNKQFKGVLMMSKTTAAELREAWKLKKIFFNSSIQSLNFDSYISEEDFEHIKEDKRNEFFNFYQTHVLPQPFFGNIEDPKIVVLAKNPAYDIFNEVVEFDALKKGYISKHNEDENLINFISNGGNDTLFDNEFLDENNNCYCTKKWWNTVFKDLLPEGGIKKILTKIGIFNLCGYHSRSYYEFPKYFLKDEKVCFPTQTALKEHLKQLPNGTIFIIIWGEPEWIRFLKDEDEDNFFKNRHLLVVNKNKDGKSYSTKRTIVNSDNFNKSVDDVFKEAFKALAVSETDEKEINIIKDYIREIKTEI